MHVNTYSLSVEELALVLARVHRPEAAMSLIELHGGAQLNQADIQSRLVGAGHSLIARGWVRLSPGGMLTVAPDVARVVGVLASAGCTLRLTRWSTEEEQIRSCHFSDGTMVEHEIVYGIVHRLRVLDDIEDLLTNGSALFEVPKEPDFMLEPQTIDLGEIEAPQNAHDHQWMTGQSRARVEVALPQLAQDIENARFLGTVLRIDHGSTDALWVTDGLLLVRVPERSWLLRLTAHGTRQHVTVFAGSEQMFRREMLQLIGKHTEALLSMPEGAMTK